MLSEMISGLKTQIGKWFTVGDHPPFYPYINRQEYDDAVIVVNFWAKANGLSFDESQLKESCELCNCEALLGLKFRITASCIMSAGIGPASILSEYIQNSTMRSVLCKSLIFRHGIADLVQINVTDAREEFVDGASRFFCVAELVVRLDLLDPSII